MSSTNAERVYVVTGANVGIGKEIVRGLAKTGATVVLACRNKEKGEVARAEIARDTGNERLEVMALDVSSLASVRAFAEALQRKYTRLDVLVNNAGAWYTDRRVTPEGFELTWVTNALGPHLLTQLLLDLLRKSAPSRVINVTSGLAGSFAADDIAYERRRFDGQKAYAASKQALEMLSLSQAEKLAGTGVTVNLMDPGIVGGTEALRNVGGVAKLIFPVFAKLFGKTPAQGADSAIWMATAPELANVTGKIFANRKEKAHRYADPSARQALWAECEKMIAEPAAKRAAGA